MPQLVSIEEYCKRQGLDSMLKEFSSKNVIPADRIGYSSKTEVIWRCKHGHEEIESPYKRFRRGYCKTCGKEQDGSFAQKYPQIAKYWSRTIQYLQVQSAHDTQRRFFGNAPKVISGSAPYPSNWTPPPPAPSAKRKIMPFSASSPICFPNGTQRKTSALILIRSA